MNLITIKSYSNIYYVEDEKIGKYLSGDVLDLDSKIYKAANKDLAIKDFSLYIRVSKVIDGKQKFKRKKFSFKDNTILQALKSLVSTTEEMLSQIQSDAEIRATEEAVKAVEAEDRQIEKSNRILNNVWKEFSDHKENGTVPELKKWKPSTARNYKSFYSKWIQKTPLGETPIKEVTKYQCRDLISEVKSLRSDRTASTVSELLRPMFDWYFEEHDIDRRNPVPKKAELDNERNVDLSLQQTRALYQAIDNYDDELFRKVFLWLRTGRRRGEVISLQMRHVDIIDKDFTVKAENNKANVDMTYKLRSELEATLPEEYDDNDYLFESPVNKGESLHVDSVSKHWMKIKEKVVQSFKNERESRFRLNGIRTPFTKLHLHDIRHIIGAILESAEVPEETIAKALGHKRKSITKRYGLGYYGDIDRAFQLFIDIIYGVVPEDTKWGAK